MQKPWESNALEKNWIKLAEIPCDFCDRLIINGGSNKKVDAFSGPPTHE